MRESKPKRILRAGTGIKNIRGGDGDSFFQRTIEQVNRRDTFWQPDPYEEAAAGFCPTQIRGEVGLHGVQQRISP